MHGKYLTHSLVVAVVVFTGMAVAAERPSEADCAARADRAARDATGVTGGAVRGAVGGAAFGAIVSDKSSRGAKRGAALGAVVGGAAGAHNRNEAYKRAYDECMRTR